MDTGSRMESLSVSDLESAMVKVSGSRGSMPNKPHTLSLPQMILLNSVVCGVEICACAGFTYIPPMLLKAGYSEEEMNVLLGMGPLLALIFVPIIGRVSDSCKSRFGRRRPYILGLSIVLVVSMYMIPFGEYFSVMALGDIPLSHRLGVGFLTVGSILLDFTSQACLTPCEAMLSDVSRESHQHDRIFTIYSVMVSLGGILGYLLTAIDWTSNSVGSYFGGQEASIFSMLIVIFTMCLTATLIIADEVPFTGHFTPHMISHDHIPAIDGDSPSSIVAISGDKSLSPGKAPTMQNAQESGYESSSSEDDSVRSDSYLKDRTRVFRGGSRRTPKPFRSLARYFTKLSIMVRARGLSHVLHCVKIIIQDINRLLPEPVRDMFCIPLVLRYLALANFCSWTAVMGFNLYFTDFVGQVVYNGNPNLPSSSAEGQAYDEGVRMGSWGLLIHCLTSAVYSVVVERLACSYGYKMTYMMGMTSFCFAMAGMVLFRNIYFVTLMAGLTGFAYATLTTIPFMLVTQYHTDKKTYFRDLPSSDLSNPERGIGRDMATLDSAYFLSQVILTVVMGGVVHVTGTVVSYMVTAGTFGLLACFFIQNIVVCQEDMEQHFFFHRTPSSSL
ncbi:LOW QUALITY PROTEIN: solute carrier family 45 member 3-like [Babylonia areolata]|uniref:LOW QUALITY PROTEIN: solute carrier family 45 member 3-like n=1 Tax=Babylonia areolata TaxID=304850 RepID=UPI003FD52C57